MATADYIETPQLIKETLLALTTAFGEARVGEDLSVEPQRPDFRFEPALGPVEREVEEELTLVARMCATPYLAEGFHQTPGVDLVLGCLLKQLIAHHRQAEKRLPVPAMWVLSAGKPESAIEGLGFTPALDWPIGVYRGPQPLVPTWIVAINELPVVPSTMIWRLFGSGRVLGEVLRELKERPQASKVHRMAAAVLHRMKFELVEQRKKGELVEDEEEWTRVTADYFENQRDLIQEGKAEAKAEDILAILGTRGLLVTAEQRQRILSCTDLGTLDRLLLRAVVASAVDELWH